MSEHWLHEQLFCPACGDHSLRNCDNNSPVADFICDGTKCGEQFELKSKNGRFGRKIVDGAYSTMISRLAGDTNPNLILLSYNRTSLSVQELDVIPKQFFIPELIERRRELSKEARRSGWVGCNILLDRIPATGRINIVACGQVLTQLAVVSAWKNVSFIKDVQRGSKRHWLLAVVGIIETINQPRFTLAEIYEYAPLLAIRFPNNRHINAKIRQQLQVLRNYGYLNFLGNGVYSRHITLLDSA